MELARRTDGETVPGTPSASFSQLGDLAKDRDSVPIVEFIVLNRIQLVGRELCEQFHDLSSGLAVVLINRQVIVCSCPCFDDLRLDNIRVVVVRQIDTEEVVLVQKIQEDVITTKSTENGIEAVAVVKEKEDIRRAAKSLTLEKAVLVIGMRKRRESTKGVTLQDLELMELR